MISKYKVDPAGSPAIHCCLKKTKGQVMLLATNTIGTYTEAVFQLDGIKDVFSKGLDKAWKELFSQIVYPVINGELRVKFKPYETKAFVAHPN